MVVLGDFTLIWGWFLSDGSSWFKGWFLIVLHCSGALVEVLGGLRDGFRFFWWWFQINLLVVVRGGSGVRAT